MSDHHPAAAAAAAAEPAYFIPPASHYPVVLAGSLFLLALGFILGSTTTPTANSG